MNYLELSNIKVAQKLTKLGINNLNISSLGNSIASGYSMLRKIKPLLNYNETLKSDLKNYNINLQTFNFSRAEDNCDAKTYEMIENNISLSEINILNWIDYAGNHLPIIKDKKGNFIGMTDEMKQAYFPQKIDNDIRIRDIINPSKDFNNIIIYNGGTGSVLDNLSRDGKHKLTFGIKKDMYSIDSIMRKIEILNERDLEHNFTQVYLCGAPKYFIPVTDLINNKLKQIARRYPHVSYVEPAKAPLIQKNINSEIGIDFHYDEKGYKILNLNIMNKIKEDYIVNRSVIKTVKKFKDANDEAFYKSVNNATDTTQERFNQFIQVLEQEMIILNNLNEPSSKYLEKLKTIILENKAHDFHSFMKNIEPVNTIKKLEKINKR